METLRALEEMCVDVSFALQEELNQDKPIPGHLIKFSGTTTTWPTSRLDSSLITVDRNVPSPPQENWPAFHPQMVALPTPLEVFLRL